MLATAFATRPAALATMGDVDVDRDPLERQMLSGPVRVIEAKEHVFREGDAVSHVYKVEVGHVCVYKTLPDGRRQVIDFAYPGDLIGLGCIGEHDSNAQATSRTRLHFIPIAALRQAVRTDGALGLKLYEAMSRELSASRELLFTVSQRTAGERVASFLLSLSRRQERNGQNPGEFVLPMTRSDIADFLGLTIETVSRTFTKLRSDGLIDLAQCVLVKITDAERLAELAEGRCD